MNTFGEHCLGRIGVEALAFLKPFSGRGLSAPAMQSGAPLAATRQAARPVTIDDGRAMFDRLSPAPLARPLRSSDVSPGLFRGGSNDLDFSHSFPISSIRPRIFRWRFGRLRRGGERAVARPAASRSPGGHQHHQDRQRWRLASPTA